MNWFMLALISAVLSAIAAIAEKKSLFKVEPLEFSALVSLFSLLFSLPFLLFFDISTITWPALAILFIKCIFNALAFYSVMVALKRLDISNSLPLMNLSPAIVAVAALIFLKEFFGLKELSGMVLVITGTYIINLGDKNTYLAPFMLFFKSKGHNYILLALASFTVSSILDKVLVGDIIRMPPEAFMFFQQVFTLLLFLVPLIILGKKKTLISLAGALKETGVLLVFIGLLTIGYRYSQILAVKSGKVALVLAVKRLSIFFACLIGGKLFNEKNLAVRLTATAIILTGLTLIATF
jgi:drug/metabolite transporter (DMT)-like permease